MGVDQSMISICENVYYFPGAVNIVYIHKEETGILVDGGLDAQRMKKVVKTLEKGNFPLTHILLTHAHADHFGGVAWLQKEKDVYTYAPILESSIMRHPILEPIYLYSGVYPLDELRNKFLEAAPIHIDGEVEEGPLTVNGIHLDLHLLPGHSYYQMGVGIEEKFFYAADAYFSKEVVDKHGVPFLIDVETTLASIEKLLQLSYLYYLPGHGQVEENIEETCLYNQIRHKQILEMVSSFVLEQEKVSLEEIMARVLNHFELESKNLGSWLLYRTSILAYVSYLIKKEQVSYEIMNHKLFITATP